MTPIEKIIKSKEICGLRFKPDRTFYLEIGINQKRFGYLLRNYNDISIDEIKKIADYFNVSYFELVDFTHPTVQHPN